MKILSFFKKALFLLLLGIFSLNAQEKCPPCEIFANNGMNITKGQKKWPEIKKQTLLKINSLTPINYGNRLNYKNKKLFKWWLKEGLDPWSNSPYWGDDYVKPDHQFKDCVNDSLRWQCGYSYVIKLPDQFNKNKKYPVIIFLHGGVVARPKSLERRQETLDAFNIPNEDPSILVAPIRLEWDWDAKKIQDMIMDIKSNLKIDENRIYLTGLSMGGRGTFIVAAGLPQTFAAIMPLSPHHGPFSYVPLAEKVANIPTWLHHSTNDKTSKFSVAKEMADQLDSINTNFVFNVGDFGHSGWKKEIYSNPDYIRWLLSWNKKTIDIKLK
tara:strand:- start:466 stop:1443 length:978 start_codon:yes stop_codon:yes gene_type:complete